MLCRSHLGEPLPPRPPCLSTKFMDVSLNCFVWEEDVLNDHPIHYFSSCIKALFFLQWGFYITSTELILFSMWFWKLPLGLVEFKNPLYEKETYIPSRRFVVYISLIKLMETIFLRRSYQNEDLLRVQRCQDSSYSEFRWCSYYYIIMN